MDWPHVTREPQTVNAPIYADFVHTEAHVGSTLPRQSQAPSRYAKPATTGVNVAYNRAYASPGYERPVDSRSYDHTPGQKYPRLKHPNSDGMSTRAHPFPPECPVHSYAALPNWNRR